MLKVQRVKSDSSLSIRYGQWRQRGEGGRASEDLAQTTYADGSRTEGMTTLTCAHTQFYMQTFEMEMHCKIQTQVFFVVFYGVMHTLCISSV